MKETNSLTLICVTDFSLTKNLTAKRQKSVIGASSKSGAGLQAEGSRTQRRKDAKTQESLNDGRAPNQLQPTHGRRDGWTDRTGPDITEPLHSGDEPILRLGRRLLELGCEDADLSRLEVEAEDIITDALQFAEASPAPEPADAFMDVFI